MTQHEDQSILGRYPITSLILVSISTIVVGLFLVFTVAGSIIGIPLLVVGALAGIVAVYKIHAAGDLPVDEIERRRDAGR